MAELLEAVSDGALCYLDATIFYYHLIEAPGLSDACSDLLERVESGRVLGVTSTTALAEATHKVMLQELRAARGLPPQGLLAKIKKHPEWLASLSRHTEVARAATALGIRIEVLTVGLLQRSAQLATDWKLLTNDAIALATMEHTGATCIATNDDDFDDVAGIRVFKPPRE